MTTRDRIVGAAVVGIVVVGGVWMEVVSPERAKVATANSKVEAAHSQLQTAQSELSKAKYAQARYADAYSSIVRLGRAVPADQEIPGLLYELDQASNDKHVEFAAITPSGAGNGASTPKSSKESKESKEKQTTAGFEAMPFSFTFNGSFSDLYHLMTTVQSYAQSTSSGELKVGGRLLTVQGFKLTPSTVEQPQSTLPRAGAIAKKAVPGNHLTGSVTATAYVLPPGTQATGGATPSGPAGSGGSGAQPASSSGSGSSSAPASATIKAAP
jgi:hypothetical protein